MKKCKTCKWSKSVDAFYPRLDGSPKDRCISCEWKAAQNARPSWSGVRR